LAVSFETPTQITWLQLVKEHSCSMQGRPFYRF